jgi:hypothetical protein
LIQISLRSSHVFEVIISWSGFSEKSKSSFSPLLGAVRGLQNPVLCFLFLLGGFLMENNVLVLNLHTQACEIAGRYQKIEIELVDILQRIDQHRVYLKFGCGCLFDYAVSQLKLSESAAYNFIAVSRKALEVPALKEAIKSQSLSVSKARRITSVITKENQETWIPMALELSQRELEKEVARLNPQDEKPEKTKFVKEDRVNLNFTVSEDLYNKIKRIQDLEAQRTGKVVSLEEALKAMTELYLEKKDPVEKAMRLVAKPDSCRVKAAAPRSRRYRPTRAELRKLKGHPFPL